MPFVPLSQCPTCQDLPPNGYSDPANITAYGNIAFVPNVNFEISARRPVNVTSLRDLGLQWSDDDSTYTHYRCPLCGAYYRHEYYLDTGGGAGPSFEHQELVRLRPQEVRAVFSERNEARLLAEFEAGFDDMARVCEADLSSANAHAQDYAVRVLADHAMMSGRWNRVQDLLRAADEPLRTKLAAACRARGLKI